MVSRALSNSAYAYTADPNLSDAYTINGLNQVTAVDATSVTYDGRGNITGDGTSTWTYDSTNRIVSGGASTLAYDPAGRLGQITSTGVDNRFLYAGAQAIGEYNTSGGLISRYVPGAGLDDYAAYTSGTGGSITRSWPMADPLGSVAAIADAAGAAIKINRYDEYGVPQSVFSGRFGYAGSMYLERGMAAPWNMRNRQYHPTLGRFLQTDPIGIAGGINLYAYVGNDPVNLVDPWGLQECVPSRSQMCPPNLRYTFPRRYYDGPGAMPTGRPNVGGYYDTADIVDDILVIERQDEQLTCRPGINRGFWEGAAYVGDALTIFGLLIGNPVVVAIGAGVSFGSDAVLAYDDYRNGDYGSLWGTAVGAGASRVIPGGRLLSRAVLRSRDRLGRYLPNWRNRGDAREALGNTGVQRSSSEIVGGRC